MLEELEVALMYCSICVSGIYMWKKKENKQRDKMSHFHFMHQIVGHLSFIQATRALPCISCHMHNSYVTLTHDR